MATLLCRISWTRMIDKKDLLVWSDDKLSPCRQMSEGLDQLWLAEFYLLPHNQHVAQCWIKSS